MTPLPQPLAPRLSPPAGAGGAHAAICVHGVRVNPGDEEGWQDRGVTWLHLHTAMHAEKYEYATWALTRQIHQDERAAGVAKMASYYLDAGWELTFIAHSNGCDITARVLTALQAAGRRVRSAHLFAAAADAAPFIAAVRAGTLAHCFVYGSPNDRALKLARLSRRALGWMGWGYGSMGLDPYAVEIEEPRIEALVREDFGHGTWFERGEFFEAAMRLIRSRENAITWQRQGVPAE
ncbi:MAG: hypothetical protein ACREIA_01340 [Opitutaceae bacterium]